MKEKLKAILKFILFILFAKSMYFWTHEDFTVTFFDFITFNHNPILFMVFIEAPLNIINKSIIMYIIAKRFGVIQFLNKFHFLISLFFACIIECLVLYHYSSYFCGKTEIQHCGDMVSQSIFGHGFLLPFFVYKIAKPYDKKHPEFFNRIKEFKNRLVYKFPILKQDLFWLMIYGILLLSIYDKKALGLNYWVFFYSGVLFFMITFIIIICNIRNDKNKP